ncbi:MAG: formylmethanofuran dehydrogenase subunit A [Candidatus Hodarchaeota archaeon]
MREMSVTSKSSLIINNGIIYDPLNNVLGEKASLYIKKDKIVDEFRENGAKVIDAQGMLVIPGGVDIHTHIAGSKVNTGRMLRPEEHRVSFVPKGVMPKSGGGYSTPTTYICGYRYAIMGYTTAFEPATPPLKTRHTHEELNDTPIIDKACFPLLGNNWIIMNYLKDGETEKLKGYIAWIMRAIKGYAIKIVAPGSTEAWSWAKGVSSLDEEVPHFGVSPKEIIRGLAEANENLKLPHTVHLHTLNLGRPGNYETAIETMRILEDVKPARGRKRVLHITHIQFNSYSGTSWKDFGSGAADIANYLNSHQHVSIDMGQVVFGNTTTMTADGEWQYRLRKLTGFKWVNGDVELETGMGVVPYIFSRKNFVNAIQWAVGLELALLTKDPWQVYLTTDHPNGGPFTAYPTIISWLMSKKARLEMLKKVHQAASGRTTLPDVDRELDFGEITTISRAATAKALGLKNKGHLGIGADADIAIYPIYPEKDDAATEPKKVIKGFSKTAYTIKDGTVIAAKGKIIEQPLGKTYWIDIEMPDSIMKETYSDVKESFDKYYTVNLSNYLIGDGELPKSSPIKVSS